MILPIVSKNSIVYVDVWSRNKTGWYCGEGDGGEALTSNLERKTPFDLDTSNSKFTRKGAPMVEASKSEEKPPRLWSPWSGTVKQLYGAINQLSCFNMDSSLSHILSPLPNRVYHHVYKESPPCFSAGTSLLSSKKLNNNQSILFTTVQQNPCYWQSRGGTVFK